jgi:N-acyl-D-amino-acid deacylase
LRSESYGILGSIENAINLAKQSNVNYMVEHAKIAGNENTWKLDSLISLVENASRSQPIVSNMYPYLEGSTNILAILPPGIKDAMLNNRVSDISNDIYRKACDEVDNDIYQWDNFVRFCNGYSGIIALSFKKDEYNKFTGKSIDYIIKHISGYPPNMPNGMQALCKIASDNDNEITIMTKYGDDMVLESLLTKPWMSICSDSLYGSSSIRHPRNLGSHPRAIRLMSKLGIPFKDISWRLSTLPSLFLGLNNPAITSQADASLVLIDPQLISETNSFENPQNEPDGIKFVITHGTIAVDNGKLNSRLSPIGQVLTRHHSELNTDK